MLRSVLYAALVTFLFTYSCVAQGANPNCGKQVQYINRNQVDPPTISLYGFEGRAIDSNGVVIPNICVALFTEDGHKFVAQTVTDENGYFRFGKVSKGRYRLVGRLEYDMFCPVNVRIRRVSSLTSSRKTKLVLHMRPSGIDDCSHGDTK
jgi:hypothetical protein